MDSYCQTDVGLKRNNNQDFVYASNHNVGTLAGLLIVADGMGGQAAGDLASRLCVETMVDSIQASSHKGAVKVLSEAIREANKGFLAAAAVCGGLFIVLEARAILHILRGTGYGRGGLSGVLYSAADIYFSAITPSATGGQPACAYFMLRANKHSGNRVG